MTNKFNILKQKNLAKVAKMTLKEFCVIKAFFMTLKSPKPSK